MSLVELMIAMVVLVIGMTALLGLIMLGMNNNHRAKQDTGGTMVAQLVMETISGRGNDGTVTVFDCANNPLVIATAPGGANTNADGNIDFAGQAFGGVPVNYRMQYRSCGAAGTVTTYDVRWRIQQIDQFSKMVTVSARPASATGSDNTRRGVLMFQPPITLKSIAVQGK